MVSGERWAAIMAADGRQGYDRHGSRNIPRTLPGRAAPRIIRIALAALLLAGCVTLAYQPRAISEAEAYAVISEVASRQAASVYLDSRFLGFRVDEHKATDRPQDIRQRIYFGSLGDIELRRHIRGYGARLRGAGGATLREFRIADRRQAERLVDALAYYRANAPEFSGLK